MTESSGNATDLKANEDQLLRVEGAGKRFGGALALEDVSLDLESGRVLGVIGENGAGKSTLMKIVGGVYPVGSYEGRVLIKGEVARFKDVRDARQSGVVLIPQELHVAPGLSCAENMFAGRLPAKIGFVDRRSLASRAHQWLRFFDLKVDPASPASVLSPSEQRLMLIAGALSQQARLLILDEPTASLSEGEASALFRHVARLRDEGIGILFISHRLDDIAQVCDEVLVLRNGRSVASFPERNPLREEIIAAMIGRVPDARAPRTPPDRSRPTVLQVSSTTVRDRGTSRVRVENVSLSVRAGEILGIFGLVGAGRTELLQALFGTWKGSLTGAMTLNGNPYVPKNPRAAIRAGIALVTEDRKQTGIFDGHSLLSNIDAASPQPVAHWGVIDPLRDTHRGSATLTGLDVRARSLSQKIETLSGGNQQKVLLGRWLVTEPTLLMLDEPTAGVDVGAREELYRQVEALADTGCGVLVVSSDLDEIRRIADRTLVMYKGRITAAIDGTPDSHELMAAATGGQ